LADSKTRNSSEIDSPIALIEELDQFDLFQSPPESSVEKDLDSDFTTFSARIQKRFEEKKEAEEKEGTSIRYRHSLLLAALLKARKAVRGVSSLNLGGRVELDIVCDDLQGWPRISIIPRQGDDCLELSHFEISGIERSGLAEITMRIPGSQLREDLLINKDEDLLRVSRTLKRNLRLYLDQLTEEIINPKVMPETPKNGASEKIAEKTALKEVDLFEDHHVADLLEKLPQMDEVEALKGFE